MPYPYLSVCRSNFPGSIKSVFSSVNSKPFILSSFILLLAGCASNDKPGISNPVSWNKLQGWNSDNHSEIINPILLQCPKLEKKQPKWLRICNQAKNLNTANSINAKQFLKTHFQPHKVNGNKGSKTGLITGYYEPLLKGSFTKTARYNYPLYKKPSTLLKVAPSDNLLKVKGSKARGHLIAGKTVPFYSRAQIDGPKQPLKGHELLWVDSSDDAFFLHIQGSGLVELEDGNVIGVSYAEQNGHPYRAIGRDLVNMQEIAKEDISLQSIKDWLTNNPKKATALKNKNPSYIFFTSRKDIEHGPRGSLNVPLTAQRSVAVDRSLIPLGTPIWLSTTLPNTDTPYQRLVLAQDTGGAINGPIRADIFFGRGEQAENLAGEMKQEGSIFVLLPK
jgi:membrane-bound lytic murein transglycosylase A